MYTAWIIATIALASAGFMLWFLSALLRESPPSVCYRVLPVRRKPEKEKDSGVLRRIYGDENCRATVTNQGEYHRQSLENENYDTQKCKSGLIAVDVRAIPERLGWRAIHAKRVYSFRELRH